MIVTDVLFLRHSVNKTSNKRVTKQQETS